MSDTITKVIEVNVSDALDSLDDLRDDVVSAGYSFKSLGDAKKYIDTLKASLIDLDEESDEYAERVEEIDKVQDKLNKAMKVTGDRTKDAEGSYNALSKQMSELKKQFKATNDEAERNALAKQITGINDQLKTMDASIGNFQRNVGNYEGAFTKGIGQISEKISSMGNPLAMAKTAVGALGNAFKALIANPIGAVIMAIVTAVKALKKGFEGNEEASNRLKKAFSAFQPVINAIQNVFTGFANIVSKIAEKAIPALVNSLQKAGEWMMKLLNKIGIVSDERLEQYRQSIEAQKEMMEVTQNLTEREIALVQKKRQFQVDEAKTEMEVSELRAKVADKDKYTAEQRDKFLDQAIKKEKALNAAKLAIAQEEFNILKERSELTDNSKEDNDALAAAEANLYNVRREYYEKERSLIKEKLKTGKELSDAEKAELADLEKNEKEKENIREQELKQVESILERTELAQLNSRDRELEILKRKYDEEKDLLKKAGKDTVNLTKEYNKKRAEALAGKGEDRVKKINDDAELDTYVANKTIQNEFEKNQKILEIEKDRLLKTKDIYNELMGLDDLSEEKKREYADEMIRINADLVENQNLTTENQKAQALDLVDTYSNVAQSIGDLMGTISDIWQDSINERLKNKKISEEGAKKEFEDSKKLQIATAIINGLAGVATAVSTAMSLGPIAGPIVGAINSATVIATTAAQIAKIKSTSFDGGGNIEGATPTPAALSYTPNYTTNVTGTSDTVNLANAVNEGQRDTRVYVVESDITEAGKRVEVREEESTF